MQELINEAIKKRIPEICDFNGHYMLSQDEYSKELYLTVLTAVIHKREISSEQILYLKSLGRSFDLDFGQILLNAKEIKKEDFIEFSRKFSRNNVGEYFCVELGILKGLNEEISRDDADLISKIAELLFFKKEELFSFIKMAKGILERNFEYISSEKFNFANYFFPLDGENIVVGKKIKLTSKTAKNQIFVNCEIEINDADFENLELTFIKCNIKINQYINFVKSNLKIIGSILNFQSWIRINHCNLELINNEISGTGNLLEIKNSEKVEIIDNRIIKQRINVSELEYLIFSRNRFPVDYYSANQRLLFKKIKELKFEENIINKNEGDIEFQEIEKLEIFKNTFDNFSYSNGYKYGVVLKKCGYLLKKNIFLNDGIIEENLAQIIIDNCSELE